MWFSGLSVFVRRIIAQIGGTPAAIPTSREAAALACRPAPAALRYDGGTHPPPRPGYNLKTMPAVALADRRELQDGWVALPCAGGTPAKYYNATRRSETCRVGDPAPRQPHGGG